MPDNTNLQALVQLFQEAAEVPTATLGLLGDAGKVVEAAIKNALAEFSRDCPREATAEGTWSGTAITLAGWSTSPVFRSSLRSIEAPAGSIPPDCLTDTDFYLSEAGKLTLITVANGTTYSVRYTIMHEATNEAATSITADLRGAFFKLLARNIFMLIAARHAETRKPEAGLDTANYLTKTQEYKGLAKEANRQYRAMLALPENPVAPAAGAATVEYAPPMHRIFDAEVPYVWPV